MTEPIFLDCSDCVEHETPRCDECLVRYIVDAVPGTPVAVDDDELRALRLLADSGVLAEVRHLRAVS